MNDLTNSWVRNADFLDFGGGFGTLAGNTQNISVLNTDAT